MPSLDGITGAPTLVVLWHRGHRVEVVVFVLKYLLCYRVPSNDEVSLLTLFQTSVGDALHLTLE